MKKFTRISALIALVLAILGAIILGVGVAMGGTSIAADALNIVHENHTAHAFANYIKNHKFLLFKHHISFDDIFDDEWHHDSSSKAVKDVADCNVASKALDSLIIDVPNADIRMTDSDTADEIHIHINSSKSAQYFDIQNNNNKDVKITCDDIDWAWNYKTTIEITFPKDCTIQSLRIDNAAGDLLLSSTMKIDDLNVDFSAGDLTLNDATIDKANFDVSAGNLIIKNVTFISKLTVDCAAGNTELTLPKEEDDYNLKLECALGDLSVDNSSLGGFGSSYKKNHNADTDISIHCACGNIEVYFMH